MLEGEVKNLKKWVTSYMDGLHGDASQNDDAKGKIQFYHETLEDTTLRLYNIERDLQNSVQKYMYNMNCTINFKVLFYFFKFYVRKPD